MSEGCPVSIFADGERFGMVSDAAQDMVDGRTDVGDRIQSLEADLEEKYAREGYDGDRATVLTARSVWNAVTAAKEHLILARTARNVLPAYRTDEPPVVNDGLMRSDLFGDTPEVVELMTLLPVREATQTALFEVTLGRIEMSALEELRAEGQQDPSSPYGQLDRAFQETWQVYMAGYNRTHQDQPVDYDARTAEYTALLGNCYVPASLLIGAGLHKTFADGDMAANSLASHAAAMSPGLAIAAGFSRGSLPKIVPKLAAWSFSNHELDHDQTQGLARIAARYTADGIRHEAAAKGMATNPHCAGLVASRPAEKDKAVFDELFSIYRQRYGAEMSIRPDGAFHKVSVILGPIAVHIARHTFYEHWRQIDPLRNKAT